VGLGGLEKRDAWVREDEEVSLAELHKMSARSFYDQSGSPYMQRCGKYVGLIHGLIYYYLDHWRYVYTRHYYEGDPLKTLLILKELEEECEKYHEDDKLRERSEAV
jgi:hypothetical protein